MATPQEIMGGTLRARRRRRVTMPIAAYAWTTDTQISRPNIFQMSVPNAVYTPADVAAQLNALPAGNRALLMAGFESDLIWSSDGRYESGTTLINHPLDQTKDAQGNFTGYPSPWLDNGTADLMARVQLWMSDFVAAGGNLDRVEFDYESGLSSWNMTNAKLRAIIADPRSVALEAEMAPWHLADVSAGGPASMRFNALMAEKIGLAIQVAEFDVVKSHFPYVTGSNYAHTLISEADAFLSLPDPNNHQQYGYIVVGTHNTWPFYGWISQLKNFTKPGVTTLYGDTPFGVVRWHVKVARGMRRSAPDNPLRPWIGYKAWLTDAVGPLVIGDTPYYDEMIYQLAINGSDDFLYFAPTAPFGISTAADHDLLDFLLEDLRTRGVYKGAVTTTLEDIAWNSDVVASGMKVSDTSVLWRITAPAGQSTVNVVKNGSVAEQLTILGGSAGVWYTTAVGEQVLFCLPSTDHTRQLPIITLDAPASSPVGSNVNPMPEATASSPDGSISSVGFFYSYDTGGDSLDTTVPYQIAHTLSIAGQYDLYAAALSDKGAVTISQPSTVAIIGDIPTVTTGTLTPTGGGAVSANGTIVSINGTRAITRGFQYGLTTSYGSTTETNDMYGTGAYSQTISGLTGGLTYHVRAFVTNAFGTGYGSDQTVIP